MKDQSTNQLNNSDDEELSDVEGEEEEEVEEEDFEEDGAAEDELEMEDDVDKELEENDDEVKEDEDDEENKENLNGKANKKLKDIFLNSDLTEVPLKLNTAATSTPFSGTAAISKVVSKNVALDGAKTKRMTTEQMVIQALKVLNDRKGTSLRAIKSYIMSNWPTEDESRLKANIKRYVKAAISKGVIVLTKGTNMAGSFKLSGKAVDDAKKKKANALKKQKEAEKAEAKKAAALEKEKKKAEKLLTKKKTAQTKSAAVKILNEGKPKKKATAKPPKFVANKVGIKKAKADRSKEIPEEELNEEQTKKTASAPAKKTTKSSKGTATKRTLAPQNDQLDEVPETKKSKETTKAATAKAAKKPPKIKPTTKAVSPMPLDVAVANIEKAAANKLTKAVAAVDSKKLTRAKQQKQK